MKVQYLTTLLCVTLALQSTSTMKLQMTNDADVDSDLQCTYITADGKRCSWCLRFGTLQSEQHDGGGERGSLKKVTGGSPCGSAMASERVCSLGLPPVG